MSHNGAASPQMTPAAAAAQSEMLKGFANLFETGQGSDLTITCQHKTFKVHSAIVASRSNFFATTCWGGFKEAQNHHIDLPDDSPVAIELMLRYLYGLDYTARAKKVYLVNFVKDLQHVIDGMEIILKLSLLFVNASMYSVGDKYGIDGLKSVASENFAIILKRPEWHANSIHIQFLSPVTRYIYCSTPETDKGLRNQVIAYAKLHLKYLLTLKAFKAVLAEFPEFSYALLAQEVESRLP